MTLTSTPKVRAKIYRIRSGVEAWLDYESIMSILKDAGYNGWMSIVYEGQDDLDEPTALPLAVGYLRSLCGKYKL